MLPEAPHLSQQSEEIVLETKPFHTSVPVPPVQRQWDHDYARDVHCDCEENHCIKCHQKLETLEKKQMQIYKCKVTEGITTEIACM